MQIKTAISVLALFVVGCTPNADKFQASSDQDRDTTAIRSEDLPDLPLAFAIALDEEWTGGCDIQKTAAFYREDLPTHWQLIDLNQDGIDEAICGGVYAIDETGEKNFIAGASGNTPCFVFQQVDGGWVQIADVSGLGPKVGDQRINGWPVLFSAWKGGIDDFSISVHVYDQGRYQTVTRYHQSGSEFLEGLQ